MSLLDTASLIVTPNGVKEGKLYSVIPSDGSGDLSVTRATTATRVNSAGLVELVPYNLNTNSENFITSWGNDGTSTTTNNFTTAPNGTMTAAKVVANFANGYAYKSLPVAVGTYTLSFYVKASAATTISIDFNDIGAGVFGQVFNLTTEWQRVSFTHNVTIGSNLFISYSGLQLGVDYYIWGAQLVEGSTAKDYQKTETRLNIPRLDYSNGTCPSILVEPQRTNIALYSEDIAQSLPTNGGGTITANNTTAPNGVTSADRFLVDTSTGAHYFYNDYTAVNGQAYTTSIFLKAGTGRYFLYRVLTNNNADRFGATIDLLTGTILSTDSLGTPTGTSVKIEDYGNGWYRVSLTINGEGTLLSTLLETSNTGTPTLDAYLDYSYTGNGTDSYYIWGNQVEAGNYSTSYIPTTSASVTRNADIISKTGISSLIGQTEGTVFVEANVQSGYDGNNLFIALSDGTSSNMIFINRVGGRAEYYIGAGGVMSAGFSMATILPNGVHKLAVAYKQNDFVFYVDGVLINTDTSGNVPAMSRINLGSYIDGSLPYNDGVKAAAIWKTRLTNTQLAQLTTI